MGDAERAPAARPQVRQSAPTGPYGAAPGGAPPLVALQRSVGNSALAQLLGKAKKGGCSCGCEGSCGDERGVAVQRQALCGSAPVLQRTAVQRDPDTDLAGTPFDAFHPLLKKQLQDPAKFPRPAGQTLAKALAGMTNLDIAALARVGDRISSICPEVWDSITKLPTGGGWATDNWGIDFRGKPDEVLGKLMNNDKFCLEVGVLPRMVHGTWGAMREIAGGAAGLHFPDAPGTDVVSVHIDFHQPASGREPGDVYRSCTFDEGLAEHLQNYLLNAGGARDSPIARYASARNKVNELSGRNLSAKKKGWVQEAVQSLDSIQNRVTVFAAQGHHEQKENEALGDLNMRRDTATMGQLLNAEDKLEQAAAQQRSQEPRGKF